MFERISEWGHKLAKILGDKTHFGVHLDSPEVPHIEEVMDYRSLWSLLPYDSFDPQTQLFFNKKSQGFILESTPLLGANEETVNILASLLTDSLPKNADLQFMLWGSDKIGDVLDRFENERSGRGEIFEWLAKKRTEFLKKGAYQSLTSQNSFVLRNFRLFISASMPRKSDQDFTSELLKLREDITGSLKSIHMYTHILSADDFIGIITDILHPISNPYASRQKWNPFDSLSMQLSNYENCIRIYKDRLQFENNNEVWESRALSVKEYPQSMAQWDMTNVIGKLFNDSFQIPCPFIVTLNIRMVDDQAAALSAPLQSTSKEQSARSKNSRFMPKIHKEYEDWRFVNNRLSEGDKLVKTYYSVVIFSETTQADFAERKIRDLYRSNGWKLKKTNYLQLQSLLAILPMIMSEGMFNDLKQLGRIQTMTAFNSVNIAPLQGEWKGSKTPSLILPGRRGQIATFNPFDNTEGNYNIAIAAASGKGKSVFTQEYIVSLLGSGGRVWVLDVGRSYEKTCKMIGGSFIMFSPESHISLNPFTHIKDFDTSLTMLKPLLAAMAHPTSRASDEEIVYLERAIKAAWEKEKNNATITTVAKWLENQEPVICKNLSNLLYSYTKEGMYGKYFEGQSNVDLSNQFVVLELQELKTKKDLQRIVMLVLMYHISDVMYLGERSQYKSCIIDEAWDLFGGENDGVAQFIETGYRTARRFNANFVTIVQSINDYFKNAMTIASYENSDTKIILGQTSESIDMVKKNERLSMDAFSERLFKSLKKTDEYSECIIKTPSGLSVHRIIFDPYHLVLYSSKGEEFDAVKNLQSQGYSLRESIELVTRKLHYADK